MIKVLHRSFMRNENYVARFRREAVATAELIHPNIVRTYELGQSIDGLYMVMEYIDGRDLQQIIEDDGPLPAADAANYIAQAALGLQHCHEAGLIHRDVKPANLLLDQQCRIKLFDMGLARFSKTATDSACEFENGAVVGTANYIAPEQARNSQTLDCRADVYSLGCTLYFLLTGQPPFPHGTITERLLKHQHEDPQNIYDFRRDAPPALVSLCQRMMSKSPAERIQSTHFVVQEIAAIDLS
jgi:serine/threonine-protein kinase